MASSPTYADEEDDGVAYKGACSSSEAGRSTIDAIFLLADVLAYLEMSFQEEEHGARGFGNARRRLMVMDVSKTRTFLLAADTRAGVDLSGST